MASWKDRLKQVRDEAIRRSQSYFAPTPNVRARDFVREIPQASVTVGRKIGDFFPGTKKFFGETIPQTLGARYYLEQQRKAGPEGARFFDVRRDLPTVFKTPRQIVGEAFQAGIELGTLGRAPHLARLARVSPPIQRAAGSAALFGGYGAARAVAEGKNNQEALKSARSGALLGAPLGVVAPYAMNIPIGRQTIPYLRRVPRQIMAELGVGRESLKKLVNAPIPTELVQRGRAMVAGRPQTMRVSIQTTRDRLPDGTEVIRDLSGRAVSIRNASREFMQRLHQEDVSLGLATKDVSGRGVPKNQAVGRGATPGVKTPTETISRKLPVPRTVPVKGPASPLVVSPTIPLKTVASTRSIPLKAQGSERNVRVNVKHLSDFEPDSLRDITSIDASFKSVYRNFQKFFGRNYDAVKRRALDPMDRAKFHWINEQEQLATRLKNEVVDGLGIGKGTKESEYVQKYGEGLTSLDNLRQLFPKRWQNIVKADQWFRREYDRLLTEVNAARAQIYPNRPDKIIPRRQDYYRHFQELTGLGGLTNILTGQANIPASLAGVSAYTRPKTKFLSFAQRRLGLATEYDAVGGYLNYVKGATYAKHIDPHIAVFRNLRAELVQRGRQTGNEKLGSRFAQYLDDFANTLAGKTNPLDRSLQDIFGRKTFGVINWINRRTKANVILGNLSSSVAQAGNLPQVAANAGYKNFIMGMADTLLAVNKPHRPMNRSAFIKERYAGDIADQFDRGMIANTKRLAIWTTRALDEVATKSGWHAFYRQGLEKQIADPGKYADDMIRSMVAGRGVGEMPLAQMSQTGQLIAPFTLEVQNLWHVLGGNVANKEFGKIAKFMLGAYVFNRAAERVRGNAVTLDPIQAVIEAAQTFEEEDDKGIGALRASGRLVGEVLSNVMFGQTAGSLYPEYGMDIGGERITRKELFGREDPTRFGAGLVAMQGLTDPLYKLLPPFGGQQIKKTISGIEALRRGHSETTAGRVRFPVGNNLVNAVQATAFGPYAVSEGRQYIHEGRQPLGDIQSEIFKSGGRDIYNQAHIDRQANRELDALKSGKKKVQKPQELSPGLYQLSNGKLTANIGDEWRKFDTPEEAQLELAKEDFRKSKEAIRVYQDKVFRRASDGTVNTEPKIKYDTNLLTTQMWHAKNDDDFSKWFGLAQQKYELLSQQLNDPTLDELDRLKVVEDLEALLNNVEKYRGYGGRFKKPRAPKKVSRRQVSPPPKFHVPVPPAAPRVGRIRRPPGTTSGVTGAYLRRI